MTEEQRTLQDIPEKDTKETMQRKKSCFHTSTIHTVITRRSVVVAVVIGTVLMGIGDTVAASSSLANEGNLTRLWERVTSHTETLLNINYYLKQTDIFWDWFQKNKGRLDEILSTGDSSSPSDNVRLLERLDNLERKQKARDDEMKEMRTALQQERERNTHLEASLRHHEDTQDSLRHQLEIVESILTGGRWEGDGRVGGEGVGGGGEEMNSQTHKLMTYVRNSVQVLSDLRDDKVPTTRRSDKCSQSRFNHKATWPLASLLAHVYKPKLSKSLPRVASILKLSF